MVMEYMNEEPEDIDMSGEITMTTDEFVGFGLALEEEELLQS